MVSISAITGFTLPGMIEEPGLHRRQDGSPPGPSAARSQQPEVVADPDQLQRQGAQRRRSSATNGRHALHGLEQVRGRRPAIRRSARDSVAVTSPPVVRVALMPGAGGRAADVQLDRKRRRAPRRSAGARRDGRGVAAELLPEADRHGVLEVGAAGLDHIVELGRLRRKRFSRPSSAGSSDLPISVKAASRIAVGKTSLVDCAMLTWSLGWTTA